MKSDRNNYVKVTPKSNIKKKNRGAEIAARRRTAHQVPLRVVTPNSMFQPVHTPNTTFRPINFAAQGAKPAPIARPSAPTPGSRSGN